MLDFKGERFNRKKVWLKYYNNYYCSLCLPSKLITHSQSFSCDQRQAFAISPWHPSNLSSSSPLSVQEVNSPLCVNTLQTELWEDNPYVSHILYSTSIASPLITAPTSPWTRAACYCHCYQRCQAGKWRIAPATGTGHSVVLGPYSPCLVWAYVKHFDTFAHESLRQPPNFDIVMELDEGSPLPPWNSLPSLETI